MEEAQLPVGDGIFIPKEEGKPATHMRVLPTKPKARYEVKWLTLWQEIETGATLMEQAMYEKPLTQIEYRVRDMMLGLIGLGNWAIINQSEIARLLRLQRQNVCAAIQRLVELGIVIKGDRMGRNQQYMINPTFCFKGKLEDGQKIVKKAATEYKKKGKVIQFPIVVK